MAEVDRVWERIGHVPWGRLEHETATLRSGS